MAAASTGNGKGVLHSGSSKALILGTSGGLAGAVAKTAIAPLERVRLLAQTGQGGSAGAVYTLRKVITNEGVAALWRGNTVNVVRMIPNKCVLLACSDLYQDAFRRKEVSSFWRGGIAGAFAGATAILFTYPLDLVRTRMAGFLLQPGGTTRYETILETMAIISREEGVRALFRGIMPTLLGSFPYEGEHAPASRSLRSRKPPPLWRTRGHPRGCHLPIGSEAAVVARCHESSAHLAPAPVVVLQA